MPLASPVSTLQTYAAVFSRSFMLSVIFSLLASAVLTLPIAAWLYHKHNGLRFGAVLSVYLCILYAFGLVFFTLYPLPSDPRAFCQTHHIEPNLDPLQALTDLRAAGLSGLLQLLLNVVFFIPLGFILRRLARWHGWAVVLGGFATSLLIETAQLTGLFHLLPCAYREFDVDDLLTNTLGALIGLLLAYWWDRVRPKREQGVYLVTRPGFLRRCVALALDWALISFASYLLVVLLTLLTGWIGRWQPGNALASGTKAREVLSQVLFVLAFLVGEVLIPLCRRGRTLMGGFVNMTIETRERHGSQRAIFYALRTLTLVLAFLPAFLPSGAQALGGRSAPIAALVWLVLGIFWLIRRDMPYDEVPGRDYPAPPDSRAQKASQPSDPATGR